MKTFAYDVSVAYHTLSIEETVKVLETDIDKGLSNGQVEERLQNLGPNELKKYNSNWWKILLEQFLNAMTIILLIAMIVSYISKDWVEGSVILFVLLTNSIVGFYQEFSAEKNMETLKSISSPTAKVVRNISEVMTIAARDLVPGDIVLLEEGDVVPADCRLVKCFHLRMDEQLLTGESVAVEKNIHALSNKDKAVGDCVNMAFSSTTVISGRGIGIAVKTGMNTEMGKIAAELKKSDDSALSSKTPAQKSLMYLAYALFVVDIFLALIVFAVNKFHITNDVATYAIAVSIAVIPEGLVAIITITMALGVRKMVKEKAIVRKLVALESLGSISNICSDKTGTLTQGKMVAKSLYVDGEGFYSVTGVGYKPLGSFFELGDTLTTANEKEIKSEKFSFHVKILMLCAALCNLSVIKRKGHGKKEDEALVQLNFSQGALQDTPVDEWEAFGDTTESALHVLSWKAGFSRESLTSTRSGDAKFKLIQEFSFDSTLKRMSMVYYDNSKDAYVVFSKGAIESIYQCSTKWLKNGEEKLITGEPEFFDYINTKAESLASKGLRVLSFGYKVLKKEESEVVLLSRMDVENDLTFIGLVGLYDPPRPESSSAIQRCRAAGITIHMLTGDHPKTAESIAREIGILSKSYSQTAVMKAVDIDKLSDNVLDQMQDLPSVIARCSPTTKVKMVQALKRRKLYVAMTGDGTNDAPSLKMADVGIAMGLAGSDVAKNASDIVLTDDNFETIVRAVFEGRRIFSNIQKFVLHLMSTNVGEVIALVIGLAFVDQNGRSVFPMSAVQILFLNMVTSTPPSVALGVETGHEDLMRFPPRASEGKGAGVFTNELIIDIFAYGIIMGGFTLTAFSISLYGQGDANPLGSGCNMAPINGDIPKGCYTVYRARGTSFITLTLLILLHAYNCRNLKKSIIVGRRYGGFSNIFSNKTLFVSVVSGCILSILTLYIPGVNDVVFRQAPITWEWGPVVGLLILFLFFSEFYKLAKRKLFPKKVVELDIESIELAK